MSSSNPNNSEDARRDDSEPKRDAAAQSTGEKNSQPSTADKPIADADFIPKFSSVRSKHDDEQEKWTQGSLAQGTFEAPKPEAEPPFNVEMQEFGFHKDVIEQPSLFRTPANVPPAQERYQSHLNQMQTPSAPQMPAPIESTGTAGDPTSSSKIEQPRLFNEPGSAIDKLPEGASESSESERETSQRVAAVRDSLYWIVEEAQLVRHGKFNDYDPTSESTEQDGALSPNAFEMYDPDALDYAPTVRIQGATAPGESSVTESSDPQSKLINQVSTEQPSLPVSESADLRSQSVPKPVSKQRSETVDERRTTYDGKKKAIAEEPQKNEQLKKALITVGSVILLCIASVVITYDTIVVKKPQDVKTEPEAAPVAPEKGEPQKEEIAKPTENPSSIKDELKKAFALEQKKNYLGALEHFDVVLQDESNKSNAKALHGRGRVLTKLQRYERALEDLEAASDIDKGNELILIDLAAVKYLLADYSGAAREYERILSAHEGDVDALYGRGISYAALGKNDQAIADFENVVKLKPNYDKAYRQMCTTFLAIDQPDKAEAAITVAMKACGADADLFFSRGLARYQMGRKEEAIEDYDEAIREDPKRKEYYNDRGYVLMELGRTDDAKKDFRQALEIDPHYKLAVDNLARIDKLRTKKAK